MLVLTRRVGETLKIGDDVTVTVRAIKGSQIRLAIAAPDHITILRGELSERPNRREHDDDRRTNPGAPLLRLKDKGGRRND